MGYRHYLYSVPRKQVAEIQNCRTNADWCNFAERYGHKVDQDVCDGGNSVCAIDACGNIEERCADEAAGIAPVIIFRNNVNQNFYD